MGSGCSPERGTQVAYPNSPDAETTCTQEGPVERVKAYVDGFNLYHGLKTRHGRKYLWLDLQALAVRLLKPSQHLVAVE